MVTHSRLRLLKMYMSMSSDLVGTFILHCFNNLVVYLMQNYVNLYVA